MGYRLKLSQNAFLGGPHLKKKIKVPEVFQSSSQIWNNLRQRSYGRNVGISNTVPTEFVQPKVVWPVMQYGYEAHCGD